MNDTVVRPTERLSLQITDKADFDVDKDDELCIEMPDWDICRAWLTRAEGQQLLEFLQKWLNK